jgi:hypothetical protein
VPRLLVPTTETGAKLPGETMFLRLPCGSLSSLARAGVRLIRPRACVRAYGRAGGTAGRQLEAKAVRERA